MIEKIYLGKSFPLGASWDGQGIIFAIFSENDSAVDVCIFNHGHVDTESDKVRISGHSQCICLCYLSGSQPRQLYGYRINVR